MWRLPLDPFCDPLLFMSMSIRSVYVFSSVSYISRLTQRRNRQQTGLATTFGHLLVASLGRTSLVLRRPTFAIMDLSHPPIGEGLPRMDQMDGEGRNSVLNDFRRKVCKDNKGFSKAHSVAEPNFRRLSRQYDWSSCWSFDHSSNSRSSSIQRASTTAQVLFWRTCPAQ
jgi:hypothetical protein